MDARDLDSKRVLDETDLAALRATLAGRRVVLGTGCFDLLHIGHLYFLEQARGQGDVLVVGVNSDRSVRTIKGDGRPVVGEIERASLIAAMRCVDFVFIYDDLAVDGCIRSLRPQIYVTGEESVVAYPTELEAAREVGASIHVVDRLPTQSTTSMLAKVQCRETSAPHAGGSISREAQ